MSFNNEIHNEIKDLVEFFCPFCCERTHFNLLRDDKSCCSNKELNTEDGF